MCSSLRLHAGVREDSSVLAARLELISCDAENNRANDKLLPKSSHELPTVQTPCAVRSTGVLAVIFVRAGVVWSISDRGGAVNVDHVGSAGLPCADELRFCDRAGISCRKEDDRTDHEVNVWHLTRKR